ncbi:hypothetical protein MWH25_08585 [Natroniella acetigena]|uniref:hypothetical protein n=1 Tax=Natroniella acetigena TaxID=52004 RepID=UPI00200A1DE2|nr:hypothetical protein [Natroniella acetigena]MCK8827796.1 hypothetical protein [Natroniella acetigena]
MPKIDKLIEDLKQNPFLDLEKLAKKYDLTTEELKKNDEYGFIINAIRDIAIEQLMDLAEKHNFEFDWSELERIDVYYKVNKLITDENLMDYINAGGEIIWDGNGWLATTAREHITQETRYIITELNKLCYNNENFTIEEFNNRFSYGY